MATTQLADVYSPTVWARTIQEAQTRKNGFLASGVAVADPLITQKLSGGSDTITLPQFNAITDGEPNYSSDDPTAFSTAKKIGSQEQSARSASRNDSWSFMSLARELTDVDPVGAVTNRIGYFWAADDEKRLINSAVGVLASNIANNGGDMVHDVSNDTTATITDANRLTPTVILAGLQTLGDAKAKITAIGMHSVQHTRLAVQQLLLQVTDPATGMVLYDTYLGKRVIVDDSLPIVVGTNKITYTVVLFGAGAFGYGTGNVLVPTELDRIAGSGNGGGEDVIYSRVNTCFHPNGYKWNNATVAGKFATYAELADATNWSRVVARKNVALAFIKVND